MSGVTDESDATLREGRISRQHRPVAYWSTRLSEFVQLQDYKVQTDKRRGCDA